MDSYLRDAAPASSATETPALSALDLLALASRAAARVACEQSDAVEDASHLLENSALRRATVWVCGDGAEEHTRRLMGAGQRAVTIVPPARLPQVLGGGDVLLVTLVTEVPRDLISEAQQRALDTIVIKGAQQIDHDTAIVLRLMCHDERALQLAQAFIVSAFCVRSAGVARAESAA